jgi:hypothetical protein
MRNEDEIEARCEAIAQMILESLDAGLKPPQFSLGLLGALSWVLGEPKSADARAADIRRAATNTAAYCLDLSKALEARRLRLNARRSLAN